MYSMLTMVESNLTLPPPTPGPSETEGGGTTAPSPLGITLLRLAHIDVPGVAHQRWRLWGDESATHSKSS